VAVVVTGSSGFLGHHVVAAAVAAGHDVLGVDRVPDTLVADLADPLTPDVRAVLAEADAVLHLAGCPGVRDDRHDIARRRRRDNVDATAHVLAAVPRDVPLVVTSSSSVYGGSTGRACVESDPVRPRGGYARSKAQVEALCAARGGAVVVARPFTLAGEGQRPDMALARWIAAARAGDPLVVYGGLERTRDVTDVRQAAGVLLRLAEVGATGAVNVGTGVAHSLGALLSAVAGAVGPLAGVEVVPAVAADPAATLADTRRCTALTGRKLVTDLDDVVRRQAAWAAQPARVPA
jgi:nucleoside-diphosphate-sugar epimerase